MTPLALAGIRVLDLSRLLPGGFCSPLLADHGADVLKVEDTGAGDYNHLALSGLLDVSAGRFSPEPELLGLAGHWAIVAVEHEIQLLGAPDVAAAVEPEAELAEHLARARVGIARDRDDPVQPQRPEALVEHRLSGLGGIALAPEVAPEGVAERDIRASGRERKESCLLYTSPSPRDS